jgi:hypothetical protein
MRRVPATKITAYAVDAHGQRQESWRPEAVAIRACLESPLSDDAGQYVARQLKAAGATEVSAVGFNGFLASGTGSIPQVRVIAFVDDESALALASLEFTFSDDEFELIEKRVRKARIDAAEYGTMYGKPRPPRICPVCGNEIPVSRSHGAKTDKPECAKALQRDGHVRTKAMKRNDAQ